MNNSEKVNDGLRLIRTCKQICDEATSILYGKSTFHFEDMFRYRQEDEPGPGSWCELYSFPIWLRYIGRHNVLKIRTICISIRGLGAAYGHEETDTSDELPSNGEALIQAFDYLSSGHRISTLEVRFRYADEVAHKIRSEREQGSPSSPDEDFEFLRDGPGKAYATFFRKSDTAVLKALRKVKGVGEFKCPDWHDIWPSAAHVMRMIKAEIESPECRGAQEKQSTLVKPLPYMEKISDKEPTPSIRERLVVMEQERAENIKLLSTLLGKMRKQGEDIGGLLKQVQGIHDTVY